MCIKLLHPLVISACDCEGSRQIGHIMLQLAAQTSVTLIWPRRNRTIFMWDSNQWFLKGKFCLKTDWKGTEASHRHTIYKLFNHWVRSVDLTRWSSTTNPTISKTTSRVHSAIQKDTLHSIIASYRLSVFGKRFISFDC